MGPPRQIVQRSARLDRLLRCSLVGFCMVTGTFSCTLASTVHITVDTHKKLPTKSLPSIILGRLRWCGIFARLALPLEFGGPPTGSN
jgi:hypothetical protein